MDSKIFLRTMAGQLFYNFTEVPAYMVLHRPTPDNCTFIKKVKYGSEKLQYMNLGYRNDLHTKKKPVFIYIHGGGWVSGITAMRDTYVSSWAQKGFFTSSISYTYAPQKTYPGQLQEICDALDYLYDRKETYNLDLDNVVFAGESAGGYYILYFAMLASDKSLFDKLGLKFRHKDEFKINALVSHCGCFNLPRLIDKDCMQSKFPDMKMFVTGFLGKNLEEAKQWLKTDEGQLSFPKVNEKFPPAFIIWADRDYLRYEAFDLMKDYEKFSIPYGQFEGTGIISMHAWTIATIVEKGRKCFEEAFGFVAPFVGDYFKDSK